MGYGRMSQAGDGPRAVPNDSSGRPQGVAPTTYPLTIHASKPKVLPQKIIGHIGRTRLWPIGIADRVNANKISADGYARYGAIAEVLSL